MNLNVIVLLFIPIVAIIMGTGTGMIAIYFNYRKRKELFALYHQERMAAIEKGVELPPLPEDFFRDDDAPRPARPPRGGSHVSLLVGLILIFGGLGLFLFLHFLPQPEDGSIAWLGMLPVGGGVACLLYYFAVGRRLALLAEEERKAKLQNQKS
jgi:hypothetical protein